MTHSILAKNQKKK